MSAMAVPYASPICWSDHEPSAFCLFNKSSRIAGHHAFREGLRAATDDDMDFDDVIQIDPYAGDPPSKRSDKEISRLLSVLDSIENDSIEKGEN